MADAGELFVRVRPAPGTQAAFTAEASGPLAAAGRDLSKVFLAAFAVGGIAIAVKGVVEAATKQQTAFAVLDQVLKNAGQTVVGFSASLHDKLEVQARATGVSAEDLAAAMDRLVPATHNSGKALKDLNTAIGISETYHISLSTAALALAKAETGSFNSLQRYLGAIPRVTTNVDQLKAKYQELAAAGAKLDVTQKAQYDSALKVAQAQDKVLTAQNSLALATGKFGGVPQAFAASYEGAFNRLHVSVEQLKVAIGTELVGGLATAASGTAGFLGKLLESNQVQDEARKAAHDLGEAFHEIGVVLKTVGPPLLTVVDALGGAVHVVEGLTAAILVNKVAFADAAVTTAAEASGLTVFGAEATAAATRVEALRATLGRLALIGAITIPIEILLNRNAIQSGVAGFLRDSGLGYFAGGNTPTPEQALADYGKIAATFGRKAADQLRASAVAELKKSGDFIGPLKTALTDSLLNPNRQAIPAAAGGGIPAFTKAQADAVAALRGEVGTDKTALAQLETDMADAIRTGAEAVDNAVQQAKQNLNTIGQSLASSIGTFIDKPLNDAAQRLADAQDRIAAVYDEKSAALNTKIAAVQRQQSAISAQGNRLQLQQIGQSFALPGGKSLSKDPAAALKELDALQAAATRRTGAADPALAAFILQYRSAYLAVQSDALGVKKAALDAAHTARTTGFQLAGDALKLRQDAAAHAKQQALTQIANLTDELNKGAISVPAFDIALAKVLVRNHLSFVAAAKRDGIAFADTFAAQLGGLGLQEAALKAGPQRAGSGQLPTIVRPLDTLAQQQKTIAGLAAQDRAKQLDETKKQTKLLKTIADTRAANAFVGSLGKNPGAGSKRTTALAGVGG